MASSPPTAAGEARTLSLRASFAATFAGNAVFAACQWGTAVLVARIGGAESLGAYALAVAIATPVTLLSHLNLRAVLATDMTRRHPFGDYRAVRFATAGAGLAAAGAIAFWNGRPLALALVIALAALVLSADNVSDIYHGAMQRRDRMDQVARSMAARGVLSTAALGVTLWATHSLPAAVAAQAAGRLAVLLAYDAPVGRRGEDGRATGFANQARIFGASLPLGVTLMLAALAVNIPRYAIEGRLGLASLGAFAAAATFITVGSTVINALGQAATPRLARAFSDGDARGFRRLSLQLTGASILLGAMGIGVAAVLGRFVLTLVYGRAYAPFAGLLVWLMAAGLASYVAGALGYILTSARAFTAQAPLLATVAAAAWLASRALVPRMGLDGAAAALAAAWLVQIAGSIIILAKALRRRPC
jgi:O-antigen/teichoic acid export membrane protein